MYFARERNETVIVIHSVWGARRRRGTSLAVVLRRSLLLAWLIAILVILAPSIASGDDRWVALGAAIG